jgi:hypothetical protein
LPIVERTLLAHGDSSLESYLEQVVTRSPVSYQPPQDLGEAVYRYAAPLLGESVARQARQELTLCPAVLTANHHGVDFFAQSVQSTLLFSLRSIAEGRPATTVPVLACGNIPINNITYPRGALLYDVNKAESKDTPQRLPIFPDRLKRKMVARVPGFDEAMVRKAENRALRKAQEKAISQKTAEALCDILTQDYCASNVLECDNYSDQAVIVNNRIWRRLFAEPIKPSELIYLELEKVAATLLQADLEDCSSLAYQMVGNPDLRSGLLQELDGARGCWNQKELLRRWEDHSKDQPVPAQACGTFLFYGIDEDGRRVPLTTNRKPENNPVLFGVDDSGRPWEIPLDSKEIIQGIQEGRLMPSLFTCYLVIGLARGITCVGGYYQADYLPVMQHGVVTALKNCSSFEHVGKLVAKAMTSSYLSGMQTVMWESGENGLVPAGPIEIIAGGGLGKSDIEQICSLTLREAHIASLFETLPDVEPEAAKPADWRTPLAQECRLLLRNRTVVK